MKFRVTILSILFAFPLSFISISAFAGHDNNGESTRTTATADSADNSDSADQDEHQSSAHGGEHHSKELNFFDWSGGADGNTPPLLYMAINFIIVGFLVFLIMRKGIGSQIRTRQKNLVDALEEANMLKAEAEKALAAAKEKSDSMDLEMARIRQDILNGAKSEAQRITEESQRRAERMQADTSALITQEVARMSQAIRTEVVEDIIATAEKKLTEKIKKADQDKLAANYLESIKSSAQPAVTGNNR